MTTEDRSRRGPQLLEDHIGRALRDSEASGELRSARSFGKPLDLGDGYDETPAELRMGYKILKDAGVLPPEVLLMQQAAAVQAELDQCKDPAAARTLRQRLSELQQNIALRLERLRG